MSLGKFKIFTFVKPSETATMSTHRVSKFISQELGTPLTWDESISRQDLDTLIIVSGGAVFSQCRDHLGLAVLRSRRVIFCVGDHRSKLPAEDSTAETLYRKSFRLRAKRGMRPIDYWSIVESHGERTPSSRYINWNMISWKPTFSWRGGKTLLYYGSWRKERVPTFDHWFDDPYPQTRILNNSGKFEVKYPNCEHAKSPQYPSLHKEIEKAGLGLYIQDPSSHKEFEAPPFRFYEMLGAGLPIVFDVQCAPMMKHAGYDIGPFAAEGPVDIGAMMKQNKKIASAQREWWRDYAKDIRKQFAEAVRSYR